MPGFLYHFACSEFVLRNRPDLRDGENRTAFLLGNVIPDLAKDKNASHYRSIRASGWKIPNLTRARQQLLANPNPLLLGCYCHLYLDCYFISHHLAGRYLLLFSNRVADFRHDRIYDADYFLSRRGLYGAYDIGNSLLLDEGLLPEALLDLPANPPLTGIAVFDNRSDKNWRAQVQHYLESMPPDRSSEVFTPEELRDITLTAGANFLKEIEPLQPN